MLPCPPKILPFSAWSPHYHRAVRQQPEARLDTRQRKVGVTLKLATHFLAPREPYSLLSPGMRGGSFASLNFFHLLETFPRTGPQSRVTPTGPALSPVINLIDGVSANAPGL